MSEHWRGGGVEEKEEKEEDWLKIRYRTRFVFEVFFFLFVLVDFDDG